MAAASVVLYTRHISVNRDPPRAERRVPEVPTADEDHPDVPPDDRQPAAYHSRPSEGRDGTRGRPGRAGRRRPRTGAAAVHREPPPYGAQRAAEGPRHPLSTTPRRPDLRRHGGGRSGAGLLS
ncbi:Exonuclease SbcC [Actinacidiphila cocklensis]|uniref:Exonuclease SbcC n=1 Tax=Actinacidiphila cocklensis TaxID=887465 RepID=A0A9W4GNU0_9ACTN|nr:Exonuclease SbcC [Actinacidiphila cocklensis]